GTLVYEGFSGLSPAVFTEMTPPPGAAGGLLNPIMGSLMLTVLAVVIGTPIGMLAGTYMAEYGKYAKLSMVVRFINDILLSAPSRRHLPVRAQSLCGLAETRLDRGADHHFCRARAQHHRPRARRFEEDVMNSMDAAGTHTAPPVPVVGKEADPHGKLAEKVSV